MNSLKVQSAEKTYSPDLTTIRQPRKQELVARWFLVDGKLTCKWFSSDSNLQPNL
jgi:hypothetical protein